MTADAQGPLCSFQPVRDGVVARVQGEIDFSRAPDFRQELMGALQAEPPRLVLDLAGVDYMDSSGVAALVEALQAQRRRGAKLVLCNLQPKVRGIFDIARLDKVFPIAADVAAACGI
jgi:anti-sigma B factor antagonist